MTFLMSAFSKAKANEDTAEDEDRDLSMGLNPNRGCTDILCLLAFLLCFCMYLVVSFAGAQHGNPQKLYRQRDFQGAYCGLESNWNNGPDLKDFPALSQTMNITNMVNKIAKQLLCSPEVEEMMTRGTGGLAPLLTTQAAKDRYLCGCCLSPCEECRGSLDVGEAGGASGWAGITSSMGSMTNPTAAADLFNPSGANGDLMSNVWSKTDEYFTRVCLPDCSADYTKIKKGEGRDPFTYEPDRDSPLWFAWQALVKSGSTMSASLDKVMQESFRFQPLPESVCPYPAAYCVPMPGVNFEEKPGPICSFKMSDDVVNSVGASAAEAFVGLSMQGTSDESKGEDTSHIMADWMGDFEESVDTFVIVAITAFVFGFIYVVLARFFMKCCVWMAAFMTVLIFPIAGGMAYVRSFQCADASMFDMGKGVAVSIAVAGSALSSADFDPTNESSWKFASETMTGDGKDYRGVQRYTVTGRTCQKWDDEEPHVPKYNSTTLPDAGLQGGFCRNPYNESDIIKAPYIWCYTTDTKKRWELCSPVGVLKPVCLSGYAVPSENDRKVLEYVSYFLWVLGVLWLVIVCLMRNRIRLAIAINQVAATFVGHTPQVVIVPVIESIVAVLWTLAWFSLASFLLSQVPDDYTPKGFFSSHAEAAGTATTPGACNDKWPTGSAWKTNDCDISVADDGSEVVKCWRCSPPRYVLDPRFAFSFFFFLWVNALKVAIGDTTIAGAVGIWFFAEEKGFDRRRISKASYNVWRYHLGSMCFGSFIIAVVQFIRYCLMYLEKQAQAQKNYVMVYVMRILQCVMWCFEKFVKFLSRKAYIMVALLGKNFCQSAFKAFFLLLRNLARFAAVGIVGQFVEWIGMAFITVSSMTVGYLCLKAMHPEVFPMVPMISYFCISVIMAKMFMGIFAIAVASAMQCFLICEEMKDPPHCIPKELHYAIKTAENIEKEDKENPDASKGSESDTTVVAARSSKQVASGMTE